MPVTSLWRIKGDVAAVVDYAQDSSKTTWDSSILESQGATTDGQIFVQDLHDVTDYVSRSSATIWKDSTGAIHRLVSGLNCDPDLAVEEMRAVKSKFNKTGGTAAYHGYQSFAEGEGPPDLIHQIGVETARKLWGDRYQVIITTHVDHENHYHNHFVINTVSFVDGKKYYRSKADYCAFRKVSDDLAKEYGFYVIDSPQGHGQKQDIPKKITWRKIVKMDVDEVLKKARTEQHFYALLRNIGYDLKTTGKDISVRAPGMQRFIRLERNFGEEYSRKNLCKRIASKPFTVTRCTKRRGIVRKRVYGDYRCQRRKLHGFMATYIRYCYMLGAIPSRKRHTLVSPQMKKDLLKMNRIAERTRYLCKHHIATKEDLKEHMCALSSTLEDLTNQRGIVRQQQRTVSIKSDCAAYEANKAKMSELSSHCYSIRKELRLCSEIEKESETVAKKIKDEEQRKQSEKAKAQNPYKLR